MLDHLLNLVECSRVTQGRLHNLNLLGVQGSITQEFVEHHFRARGHGGLGQGNEDCALAFSQIVSRGLPRHLGVSKDAEDIVPELKRNSQGQPEGREITQMLCARPGE